MKRVLKCGISMLVFAVTATKYFLVRLVGRTPAGTCVVLYYHSIPEHQRKMFADQLAALIRNATPIALDQAVQPPKGMHAVAITFDDGFENFYSQALPELEKRRLPATMFVIADALGKAFGPLGQAEDVMSLDQIRRLPSSLVTIGSHTSTHPMLPLISAENARDEIAGSRKKLEALLHRNIRLFSFPFGGFNQRLIEICRQAGYDRVFTTLPKIAFREPNEFVIGRVRVDPGDWSLEFHLKVAGAYQWLPWAFRLKSRVLTNPFARLMSGRKRNTTTTSPPGSAIRELN
jgi:peptidoglycan/xylan/chitin deacetylase (PgdA/CDA1 family)